MAFAFSAPILMVVNGILKAVLTLSGFMLGLVLFFLALI